MAEFLQRLLEFLGEENFEESLTNFLKNYAGRLEFGEEGEEQSLKTFDVYRKWQRMMEIKLEKFAEREGLSNEQMQKKCAEIMEKNPSAASFMNALLSSFELEQFIDLAKDYMKTGLVSVHKGLCVCLESFLEEEKGCNLEDDSDVANAIFDSIVEAKARGVSKSLSSAKATKAAKPAKVAPVPSTPKSKQLPGSKASAPTPVGTSLTFSEKDMKVITEFAEMMDMKPQEAVVRIINQHLFDLQQMQAEYEKVLDFN
ncbi:hypothetical protein CYMTET_7694 [Cymbomonas tetramitiformis]|uniref:BART domain-containing protein n=1 Tax=Cymbomonas tetramitiformis TaxID=36881 RepID=A0AAE0LH74_9CHLO|nr:hypothetical protein CYMTET_7694 [Cymbomonas tetramitiformis]|eukprot:gene4412-5420_t